MRLRAIQQMAIGHPFNAWLITGGLMMSLSVGGYLLIPGRRSAGLLMLFLCIALSPSTRILVARMSDRERERHPVTQHEEAIIGSVSVIFAVCSIVAVLTDILHKRLGVSVRV